MDFWQYEKEAMSKGYAAVCGCDEAGAGPLAGPVYAAAVILPFGENIPGLDDSKKLKEKKKQLEQQLKMAAGNEQKTKELEAKLAQVEAELSVKDTAEYKKQHAEYTTEE